MIEISVVIPSYNMAPFVSSTIESVLTQESSDVEVIVVDDGSQDNTAEVVKPYLDRIVYQYQPNRGVAEARNHGIDLARGRYIRFLDADDVLYPASLSAQRQALARASSVALAFGQVYEMDAYGNI